MQKSVIKIPCGYVVNVNHSHMIVVVVDEKSEAKKFTPKRLESFIEKYSDIGYGMSKKTLEVISI